MKIFKKAALGLASIFIFSSLGSFNVYASELKGGLTVIDASTTHKTQLANGISPLGIVTCDASPTGVHEAFARGVGILYSGSASGTHTLFYDDGCAWQCPYCYQVVVTEGEAALGMPIGFYATYNPGYEISRNGIVMYSNYIQYTSSSTLPGFHFRYN